ncbi:DUF1353 domain-containing protein [Methylobacterium sp. sgz302541]|uniref:DUF1353 domain-containing protein n=1 Tax=unclassified Methylobacterium TaxID=2615210 RepID=UPI003D345E2B
MRIAPLASVFCALALGSCATLPITPGPGGTLTGQTDVRWLKENYFLYIPFASDPLTFVGTDGKKIVPQTIYTDGGSIPPMLWGVRGFSPWGYGPAYIVHDWLFVQHHCKIGDWQSVSFEDSARILGEVIDTLVRDGRVPPNPEARSLIELAVRTRIARDLWDNGPCDLPPTISTKRAEPQGVLIMRIDTNKRP